METLLYLALGAILGGVIVWLALSRRLAETKTRLEEREKNSEQRLEDQRRQFGEMMEAVKDRFASIAAEKLAQSAKSLSAGNAEDLSVIVKPLKEQMEKFQRATTEMGVRVQEESKGIQSAAKSLEATASIIRGSGKQQGLWGEQILEERLVAAGLEKGISFFLQKQVGKVIPDALVKDAQNRWLVIDSKVSLSGYVKFCNAPDDAARSEALKEHVGNIRKQINSLHAHNYPAQVGEECIPVTAMFVPSEPALLDALHAEPALWQEACDKNVVLLTPLTLLSYLRIVSIGWTKQNAEKKYKEVVKIATELYQRANDFVAHFEKIGEQIAKLNEEWNAGRKRLVDGERNQSIAKSYAKLAKLKVLDIPKNEAATLKNACKEDENPLA